MKMPEFDRLQVYIPLIRIAHHIPGRIRLKLNHTDAGVKHVAAYAKRFDDIWQDIPGIRSAKLNLMARSCTVEYDKNLIPFHAWQDLLEGAHSDEALELLALFKRKVGTLLRE